MTLKASLWALVAALPALSLAASPARVFLSPNPKVLSSVQGVELKPAEAESILRHHLGLDMTALDDDVNNWWNLVVSKNGGQSALGEELLEGIERDSALVVIEADESDFTEFLPDWIESPSLTISSIPASFNTLISTYKHLASQAFSIVRSSVDDWSDRSEKRDAKGYKTTLDTFDFAAASEAAESFVNEFSSLAEYTETVRDLPETSFGAFAITTLPGLKKEFGANSDEYTMALRAVKAALSTRTLASANLALVVVPLSAISQPQRRQTTSAAVSLGSQVPFPPPRGNTPIFSNSVCFASATDCTEGTRECSNRGQCVPIKKGSKECYVCQCAVTKDSKNRTEYWSGNSCQTLDASSAFTMLVGTSLAIVIIIGLAISLLYSIGNETLPGVLTGATAINKRD